MKNNYDKQIKLRCAVCGSDSHFEFNEDKSYVKCTKCSKEYFGGYDELLEYNKEHIDDNIQAIKNEISDDLKQDINDMLKNAFRGDKNIKFK